MMMKSLKDIDLYRIYKNWRQGSGPYRCFFRSTNFVSLKHYPDFFLHEVPLSKSDVDDRIAELIALYDRKETLFLLDIPGKEAIKAAFFVQKSLNLKCILTFNGILHPFGLVGDRDYVSRLLNYGDRLDKIDPEGFMFILDYDRYREVEKVELHQFFNNQYEISDEDLPSDEMLKDLGYRQVAAFYREPVKEDLSAYLSYLEENNLKVYREEV
ncbi:MAG: hypothetical protein N2645_07685 [Clostridia bacterium]|nr:hypothetical protein [Clostridia bacterium]